MTSTHLTTLKLVVPALAAAALSLGAAASTAHADVSINCSIPLNVKCTVSDPVDGIASIIVRLDTALGPIDVVDKTYSCVSSASVSWDPIVPGGDILVTTCGGVLPPQSGRGWGQQVATYNAIGGRIQIDTTTKGSLDVPRPGIDYAMRTPLRTFIDSTGAGVVSLLLPLLSSFAPSTAEAELVESAHCCYDGTNTCVNVNLLAQCGEGLYFKYCSTDDKGVETCTNYPN
jgi:hypothetical protein